MIVCERGDLLFVFNFHPTSSYTDYRVGCNASGPYKVGGWVVYSNSQNDQTKPKT